MVRASGLRVLPESRSECRGGARPCPLVSCRYNLLLDVATDGRMYVSRDFDENDEESIAAALKSMRETCALDVADRGATTSVAIAKLMNLRRDSVEKLMRTAFDTVRASGCDFESPEHPEDFYLRYSLMGADELAEIASELRARGRRRG